MLNKVCFVAKTNGGMRWDDVNQKIPNEILCAKCWPRTHGNFEAGCIYKPS